MQKQEPLLDPLVKIAERYFQTSETACNRFHITVPPGTTREALLNPRSYAHIGRHLGPLDELTVVANDGSFYSRFLVLYADRLQAKVVELEWHQLAENQGETASEEYTAKHFVNRDIRWAVIRMADKARVAEGMQTKEEALAWIAKNQARLAA